VPVDLNQTTITSLFPPGNIFMSDITVAIYRSLVQ